MRIISLNTWGGRAGKGKLLTFFKERAKTTDIFCLQEIWAATYKHLDGHLAGGVIVNHDQIMTKGLQDISAALPNYTPFFRPHFMDSYGILMMVKKDLKVMEEGEVFVHQHKGYMPEGDVGNHARNIQYVTIETASGPITIINFHGLWTGAGVGKGKKDSPERIEQSVRILEYTKKIQNPFILCGDFNLLPDTESLRMFENQGLRNLIREYGVTSTRTSFYMKPQKFADYAFISRDIPLKNFSVLPDEVSDHAPLFIEI
ncbi:MAG: endonuclease/exonuclease/phosphatase family protein [Minisyncoccota bacterium]